MKATERTIFECQIDIWQVSTRGPLSLYIHHMMGIYTSQFECNELRCNNTVFHNNCARTIITL